MPIRLLAASAVLLAAPAVPAQTPDRPRADLFFLAGPECEGRGVETAGIHKAAAHIADEFRRVGLKPAGADGMYFQPFTIDGNPQLGTPNTLTLTGPDGKPRDLKYGTDFTPVALSGTKKLAAGVVFAGYGVTSKEPKYDDYANLDVKGQWVAVLRQAPRADGKNPPFDAHRNSPHPALSTKLANAVAHGAAGVIFVNHKSEKDDPLMAFGYASGPSEAGVTVVHVKRTVLETMFAGSGTTLAAAEAAIDADFAPQSRHLAPLAAGDITVSTAKIPARNVVGVLDGSGPLADETVVIGAHHDHVGTGETGSAGGKAA
ncbi:MAG: PA domain-containing protein, partial [Fimbriiglobus sp.]